MSVSHVHIYEIAFTIGPTENLVMLNYAYLALTNASFWYVLNTEFVLFSKITPKFRNLHVQNPWDADAQYALCTQESDWRGVSCDPKMP